MEYRRFLKKSLFLVALYLPLSLVLLFIYKKNDFTIIFLILNLLLMLVTFFISINAIRANIYIINSSKYLSNSIAEILSWSHLNSEGNNGYIHLIQKNLDHIAYACSSFIEGEKKNDDFGVTCSLMIFSTDLSMIDIKDFQFISFDHNINYYDGFLVVKLYSQNGERKKLPKIVIPYNKNGNPRQYLPGAPYAFFTKKPYLVPDTLNLKKCRDSHPLISDEVWKEMISYFESNKNNFRSFISIPLVSEQKFLGVLNINSEIPHYFDKYENILLDIIMPYVVELFYLANSVYGEKSLKNFIVPSKT